MVKLVAVDGPDGTVQLYDIFLDGVWFGSRRTVEHAAHMAVQWIGLSAEKEPIADFSQLHVAYDDIADVLYLRKCGVVFSHCDEDEDGLVWRLSEDHTPFGVTILDFKEYWAGRIDQLVSRLAIVLRISKQDADKSLAKLTWRFDMSESQGPTIPSTHTLAPNAERAP